MFELGLRLAFDKPTIIIKDDKTSYSFDTSPIEHLDYPRDLRFTKIIDFKKNLKEKIKATYEKSKSDPNYTTFLKHFGSFTVAKLDSKELSKEDFIIEELSELRRSIARQERNSLQYNRNRYLNETARLHTDGYDDRIVNIEHERIHELVSIIENEVSKYSSSKRNKMPKELRNEIKQNVLNKFPIIEEQDLIMIDNVLNTVLQS